MGGECAKMIKLLLIAFAVFFNGLFIQINRAMQVNGIIYEELFATGEVKSFVFNQFCHDEHGWKFGLWVSLPDEYEENKGHSPVHFLEDRYAQLFESVYEGQPLKKIGSKRFRERSGIYEYHTEWSGFSFTESYEAYLYTLVLPEYAVPVRMDDGSRVDNILKDGNKYIIYTLLQRDKGRSLKLDVIFTIDEHKFKLSNEDYRYNDFSDLLQRNYIGDFCSNMKTVEALNRAGNVHVILNVSGGNVTVGNNIQQTVVNHFDSDKFEYLAEELKKYKVTKNDIEELKVLIQQGNVDVGSRKLSEGIQDWIARVKTSLYQGGMAVSWNILTNIIWQYYH